MPLAKPIECDTDNGWPENNEVGVYRAPLCESAEGLPRSSLAGMQHGSGGQRHQSTARCARYCDNNSSSIRRVEKPMFQDNRARATS